ncbi:zf-HC2 domain-containing protein [Candidatus Latescibacterota bacterium]
MNCEKINKLIPDYISGNLDSKTRLQIDSHITECASCKQSIKEVELVWSKLAQIPQEEPGPQVRTRFYSMLEDYRRELDYSPVKVSWNDKLVEWLEKLWPSRPVFQLGAAVAFMMFGIVIGLRVNYGFRYQGDIAQLREEVHEMRQMVTSSLLDQSSAVERLHGLRMSSYVKDPDEQFLSLLLVTLNSDPNINVRLAAVNALRVFCDSPWVRTELTNSLSSQTSPLVQISLIDLLVEVREQGAFAVFSALIDDQKSIEEVKKRAKWGINQII